jgi:Cu-Zn family superoxide dismutase
VHKRWNVLVVAIGIAALASRSVALADHGGGKQGKHGKGTPQVFTLDPSTHGNPEGVATRGGGKVFFVGATGDGTIYRGTVGNPTVTEFIAGAAGKSAVGMKIRGGKLYVAGGMTGKIYVYSLRTKELLATFDTGSGGFLNDLVVTGRGVFVTDSFRPTLWRVTNAQLRAGSGTPQAIPVGPEIAYASGFNLNGIVARGHKLIVVQSNTGNLFSIDVHEGGTAREIHEIASDPVVGGDGMLLDRGRLIVVRGSPAALLFLKLKHHASSAELVATQTDPTLGGPSTVARARHLYLVVNADFATSTTPFTVSGLPRGGKH